MVDMASLGKTKVIDSSGIGQWFMTGTSQREQNPMEVASIRFSRVSLSDGFGAFRRSRSQCVHIQTRFLG